MLWTQVPARLGWPLCARLQAPSKSLTNFRMRRLLFRHALLLNVIEPYMAVTDAWGCPAAEQITYCYALLYGGLVQLLAGMWAIYRNKCALFFSFSNKQLAHSDFLFAVIAGPPSWLCSQAG